MVASIWLLILCSIKAQNIEWFKETDIHYQNIQKLSNGWTDCPEWEEMSQSTKLSLFSFGSINTIQLPVSHNTRFGITAQCIIVQVPLNWDDTTTSDRVIDYYISRIFSSFNPNNHTNGAFWMLQGGPGAPGTTLYPITIPFMNFIDNTHDLYIPDHRGTGYSNSLNCPDLGLIDPTECVSFLEDEFEHGDDIKYFSTYSASMDLGYVIDLFKNNLNVYNDNNTIIWGASYGTYYLNQYLTLFPNQSNAAIFDSICDSEQCRFSQFDHETNDVGLTFIERCADNEFCDSMFRDIGTNIFDATQQIFDDIHSLDKGNRNIKLECVAKFHPYLTSFPPSIFRISLKEILSSNLQDVYERILIPPIIYRLFRCNNDDINVFHQMFSYDIFEFWNVTEYIKILKQLNLTDMYSNISDSGTNIGLYYNIVFSELWDGLNASHPGSSYDGLLNASNTYYFSSDTFLNFRRSWNSWNKYIPNPKTYNKFADPPIPILLLGGDLDPQTHINQGLHTAQKYDAVIDDPNAENLKKRYFFTFSDAPHGVLVTTLIKNYTDNTIWLDYDFETCGLYVVKSFIDPNNDFIPDTQCINWLSNIDWEGTSYISKTVSFKAFGTTDLWQKQDETETSTKVENAWFIVGIIFICLCGITMIGIGYLIYLLYFKKPRDDKIKYKQSGDVENDEAGDIEIKQIAEQKQEYIMESDITGENVELIQLQTDNNRIIIHEWFNKNFNFSQLDIKKYTDIFIMNGFDNLNLIKQITSDDLKSIGISKLGHRKLILKAIQNQP